MLTKEDIINNKSHLLPTAKLSDAVRQLNVGKVRSYHSNLAELAPSKGKPGIAVSIDTLEGLFEAVLLNEWDEEIGYVASCDLYNDAISSNSWRVVSAWIKDKLS